MKNSEKTITLYIIIIFSISTVSHSQNSSFNISLTDLKCPGGIPTSIYLDKKTDTFYAGCYGGIWRYHLSSSTWEKVGSDPDSSILSNAKITSMFIDSKGIFYAGCSDLTPSYISFDVGKTWRQIINLNFTLQSVNCIMEHPNGNVYFGTNYGILKTTDNGRNWIKVKNCPSSVNSILTNSAGILFAGVGAGMFYSVEGDSTWNRVPLPGYFFTVNTIAKNSKGIMYAGAHGDIYKSNDDGLNWYSIKSNFGGWSGTPSISKITITSNDIIYIVWGDNTNIYHRSSDNGDNWQIAYTAIASYAPSWGDLLVDSNGNIFGLSNHYGVLKIEEIISDVKNQQDIPISFILEQNYPNPFNPSTLIKYSLPQMSKVTITVFDLLGREIATLINEEKPAGLYEVKFNADNLSSGLYFYRIQAGDFMQTKKMILLK